MKNISRHYILFLALFLIGIAGLFFFLNSHSMNKVRADDYFAPGQEKMYTVVEVKEGDTLWSIAGDHISKEYKNRNEYIDEIRDMNHITGSCIEAGSYILVPYYCNQE